MKTTRLLSKAGLVFSICIIYLPAVLSSSNLTFAVIPKNTNNPFHSVVKDGCMARAALLPNIDCLYVGPEEEDSIAQADIVDAMINGTYGQIDGISISVNDASIIGPAIDRAIDADIPVITYDSDAPDSTRTAYIGTDNHAFGVELGKLLAQLSPLGGTYGIIAASAPNVMQRVEKVRERLSDTNWVEVDTSYKDGHDSTEKSMDMMYEYAAEGVDAVIPVGGWPMWDDRWPAFVDANRNMMLVVGDTLPSQMDLMNRGYVNGLVGQLPFEMGSQSMDVLLKIVQGEEVDATIYGTAFLEVVRFPLMLPDHDINENFIGGLAYLGYVLFGMIAATSLSLMVWIFVNKETRVVNASQHFFLQMILVGILIFSSAIVPLTFDTGRHSQMASDAACMSVPWLMTIGFTTIFSALFAKTWRVNQLFNNPNKFSRIKVTEKDVLLPFIIMMTMNIIVLSCWTAIVPLTYQRFDSDGTDEWNRIIATYGVCTSRSEGRSSSAFLPYLLIILAINIGLLIMANIQSYRARSIRTEYSESKYITIIMASMLQAFALGVPCICLMYDTPRAYFTVLILMIGLFSIVVLGFMFVPKISQAWKAQKVNKANQKTTESCGDDGMRFSILPNHKFGTVTSINTSQQKVPNQKPTPNVTFKTLQHDEETKEQEEESIQRSEGVHGDGLNSAGEDDIKTLSEALLEISRLRQQHQLGAHH